MDHEALMEAIVGARAQLDFQWQFFVSAQLAVFALAFIYHQAVDGMSLLARLLAVAAVGAFDWINGHALIETYGLLDALHDQYRASFGNLKGLRPAFVDRFVNLSFTQYPLTVKITHTCAFVAAFIAFVVRSLVARRPAKGATAGGAPD